MCVKWLTFVLGHKLLLRTPNFLLTFLQVLTCTVTKGQHCSESFLYRLTIANTMLNNSIKILQSLLPHKANKLQNIYNSNLTFLVFFHFFPLYNQMCSKRKIDILNIYLQASFTIIFRKPGNSSVGVKKKKKGKPSNIWQTLGLSLLLCLLMAVMLLCLWRTVQFSQHYFPLCFCAASILTSSGYNQTPFWKTTEMLLGRAW